MKSLKETVIDIIRRGAELGIELHKGNVCTNPIESYRGLYTVIEFYLNTDDEDGTVFDKCCLMITSGTYALKGDMTEEEFKNFVSEIERVNKFIQELGYKKIECAPMSLDEMKSWCNWNY